MLAFLIFSYTIVIKDNEDLDLIHNKVNIFDLIKVMIAGPLFERDRMGWASSTTSKRFIREPGSEGAKDLNKL